MDQSRKLIVKFMRGGDPSEQQHRIRSIVGDTSVHAASQLFPDDPDDELATLYEVTLSEDASIDLAVTSLDDDGEVEYAHEPQERAEL